MKPINIAYFGTGDFSKNILQDICEKFADTINVKQIVSQPNKAIGRKQIFYPTPVAEYALDKHIILNQPIQIKANQDFFEELKNLDLDFIVVVAYGKIIPKDILSIPKHGCINIHGSILPKYRGASPIQESLKNGDTQTGLTIMYMSEGMDEGNILKIRTTQIDKLDKTPDVFTKFEQFGAELLIETLQGILKGNINSSPQDNLQATYCSKISKTDGEIDFTIMTSEEIFNTFRAYYPWPGIYCFYGEKKLNIEDCTIFDGEFEKHKDIGMVIKINKHTIGIMCVDKKVLQLKQVKLEGKKSLDILSFINGNKDFLDYKF